MAYLLPQLVLLLTKPSEKQPSIPYINSARQSFTSCFITCGSFYASNFKIRAFFMDIVGPSSSLQGYRYCLTRVVCNPKRFLLRILKQPQLQKLSFLVGFGQFSEKNKKQLQRERGEYSSTQQGQTWPTSTADTRRKKRDSKNSAKMVRTECKISRSTPERFRIEYFSFFLTN